MLELSRYSSKVTLLNIEELILVGFFKLDVFSYSALMLLMRCILACDLLLTISYLDAKSLSFVIDSIDVISSAIGGNSNGVKIISGDFKGL